MAGILIVDDSATARAALKLALRATGHEIAEAPSAERALQVARLLKPGLVVSDLNLPGMNGIELTRCLVRELDPPPPVLLVTGDDAAEWTVGAREAGAASIVSKPISASALLNEVRRLLGETQ